MPNRICALERIIEAKKQIRSFKKMLRKTIPYVSAAILILAGCESRIRQPMEICPGKDSVADALAALKSQSQNVVPLRANGQCRLEYYVEGKKKPQRENFNVKLWVNPPF